MPRAFRAARVTGCAGNGRRLLRLSEPKLVHASEKRRILGLECMPQRKIGLCAVMRKTLAESLQRATLQVEAQEIEPVVAKKVGDLGQRQLMFLNMEQQIAAPAGAEKIEPVRHL